jgi:hypothetical protein
LSTLVRLEEQIKHFCCPKTSALTKKLGKSSTERPQSESLVELEAGTGSLRRFSNTCIYICILRRIEWKSDFSFSSRFVWICSEWPHLSLTSNWASDRFECLRDWETSSAATVESEWHVHIAVCLCAPHCLIFSFDPWSIKTKRGSYAINLIQFHDLVRLMDHQYTKLSLKADSRTYERPSSDTWRFEGHDNQTLEGFDLCNHLLPFWSLANIEIRTCWATLVTNTKLKKFSTKPSIVTRLVQFSTVWLSN